MVRSNGSTREFWFDDVDDELPLFEQLGWDTMHRPRRRIRPWKKPPWPRRTDAP